MAGISAGSLDRRITFQRRAEGNSGIYNRKVTSWEDHVKVWAEVRDMLPSRADRMMEGLSLAKRPCRIRCRYRGDITGDMRVVYGTRILRIVSGPVELGRREGLELLAEDWSTQGEQP